MNIDSVKTITTIKIDDYAPCRKKLNVETKPAIKKWEQIRYDLLIDWEYYEIGDR